MLAPVWSGWSGDEDWDINPTLPYIYYYISILSFYQNINIHILYFIYFFELNIFLQCIYNVLSSIILIKYKY